MPTFRCEICDSYEVFSSEKPEFCPNCGSQKGPWKKIREDIKITNGGFKFIVYKSQEFGRTELKSFFGEVRDSEGNPIYKYCDANKPMLIFSINDDEGVTVKCNAGTKNYFLLNGIRITEIESVVRKKDMLVLFSQAKSTELARFLIE